jgi:uncharacterized protein (DUF362 family)
VSKGLSRRELARLVGASTLALIGRRARASSERGRVGLAAIAPPAGGTPLEAEVARAAVSKAIAAATGATSGTRALAALFGPHDTVGIKVNTLGGRHLSPRRELVDALAGLLAESGVDRDRIVVFDRSSRELRRAGYELPPTGHAYVCRGIDNEYDAEPSMSGAIGSCFARLVSTICTALIGFGVVKDHDLAGVSASLKNWYGVIHNPNKYHDNNCDPYAADVVNHPYVRKKLRLTLLDGVVAQCHGGPAWRPDTCWPLGLVLASTDPVAPDVWAWRVIDRERKRRGLPTLAEAKRPPRFVATAARYGLGVGDVGALVEVRA